MSQFNFITFSKPFLDALQDTFTTMLDSQLSCHSPKIKTSNIAKGDITAIIGMNGLIESSTEGSEKSFKGLLAISWPEEVYLKVASKMLFEEFSEFNEEVSDCGAEIVNIVMGNAKGTLAKQGFKMEMASPSTIKGKAHEIKYPPKTTVIDITCSCAECGDFSLELCYQEV